MVHAWLSSFVRQSYFQPCECQGSASEETTSRERQLNYFWTDGKTWRACCSHCKPLVDVASDPFLIQVRRSSRQDVVKLKDIQDLAPSAAIGVQAYTINGLKVAFLRTRPVPRLAKGGPMCITCSRSVQENSKFCSLECKMVTDSEAPSYPSYPITTQTTFQQQNLGYPPAFCAPGFGSLASGSPGSPSLESASPSSSEDAINLSFNFNCFAQHPFCSAFSPAMSSFRGVEGCHTRKRRKMAHPRRSLT